MSHVGCQVSRVRWHVSCVMCQVFFWGGGQSSEASQLGVCYQRCLHRIVFQIGAQNALDVKCNLFAHDNQKVFNLYSTYQHVYVHNSGSLNFHKFSLNFIREALKNP